VVAAKAGGPHAEIAERLGAQLEASGLSVLFDDRTEVSVGVKFNDAELIGIPTIVVIGRGVSEDPATSMIEIKDRRSGDRTDTPLVDAVATLVDICRR